MEISRYLSAGSVTLSNLLLKYYRQLNLSEIELVMYIQLSSAQQRSKKMPDIGKISEAMGLDVKQGYHIIESLMRKGCIQLCRYETEEGKEADAYDLSGVFQKIDLLERKEKELAVKEQLPKLVTEFELELGRTVSPYEIEQIQSWLQNYSFDLIVLALKETVYHRAKSPFRYLQKILEYWRNQGANTVEKAKMIIEESRNHKLRQEKEETPPLEVPIFEDWNGGYE